MINTIEVPISLIKSGDMDAIRKLLPKENLFGRWATHPKHGHGIILNAYPDRKGTVWIACEKESEGSGRTWAESYIDDLTLDPVELTTEADFEDAPEGTIVADSFVNAYQKADSDEWVSVNDELSDKEMKFSGPWKILRWGWGE